MATRFVMQRDTNSWRIQVWASFVLSLLACGLAGLGTLPARADSCQFLNPVGGNGVTPIVTKTISAGNPLPFGRPNWNTDFYVTQQYRYFKLFFTADSSVSATYPIQAFLKFSDGSNLQVYNSEVTRLNAIVLAAIIEVTHREYVRTK